MLLTEPSLPATGPGNPRDKDHHLLLPSLLCQLGNLQAKGHCQGKARSSGDQRGWTERAWKMQEKELGAESRPLPKRVEVKTALCSLPTDRCGPPESIAGQAKIPQEAGEGEKAAHTTEEIPIYEKQGELRLETAHALSPAVSDLVTWYPTSQYL